MSSCWTACKAPPLGTVRELRITAPDLWGEVVLTLVLLRFRADHPEVRIIADFSNTPADLLRDNLHVAFRSTELGTQPYLARPIAVDDLVLCASADYLDRHPPSAHRRICTSTASSPAARSTAATSAGPCLPRGARSLSR